MDTFQIIILVLLVLIVLVLILKTEGYGEDEDETTASILVTGADAGVSTSEDPVESSDPLQTITPTVGFQKPCANACPPGFVKACKQPSGKVYQALYLDDNCNPICSDPSDVGECVFFVLGAPPVSQATSGAPLTTTPLLETPSYGDDDDDEEPDPEGSGEYQPSPAETINYSCPLCNYCDTKPPLSKICPICTDCTGQPCPICPGCENQ